MEEQEKNNVKNSKTGLNIAIVIIFLLILIIVGLGSYIFLNEKDSNNKNNEENKEENKETEKEDETNKEDNSSENEQKEEEISFNKTEVNQKLNDTFSTLLNLFPSENDNDYLDDASGRITFLILNYEKARLGKLEENEETFVNYTTIANLKEVYKIFYGSLDNYSADTTNNDLVTFEGEKANLFTWFGDSANSYELNATKLVYNSKKDTYVLSGTCIQKSVEAINYPDERYFVLEYKKANNSNYLVSFSIKSNL